MSVFDSRSSVITAEYAELVARPNQILPGGNGVYDRWLNPIITADHVPLNWRYDFSPERNPFFLERLGVNAAFNAGAIKWGDKYLLAVRVEGVDRKSFFAIAQSSTGVDQFQFWDRPVVMPETDDQDTNVYDMRLVRHEDGWVYGLFCTERKDRTEPNSTSAAVANCGIARTKDLIEWHRLPDLISHAGQQRNVVLHPEFVDGQYAFYTRPQDGFISVGAGGGIGWGLASSIEAPEILDERVFEGRRYHTVYEVKNGLGPAPIKTDVGWLHLAHGVRNTAAGLRYVLYLFVTHPEKPWEVIFRPGGHLIAPLGDERVGDVSNVAFSNGWIADEDGSVFIYYASSDTRMHVATTSIDRLIDYAVNTPPDAFRSAACVQQRIDLINQNQGFWK